MPPAEDQQNPVVSNRAPRAGVRLMIIIVVATALLAIYSNVQKSRRSQIEKVTIIPVATPPPASPTPGA